MYKTLKRHHGSPLPPSADTVTAALRAKSEFRIITAVKCEVQVDLVEKDCRLPSEQCKLERPRQDNPELTYYYAPQRHRQEVRRRNRVMPAPKDNAEHQR